MTCKIITIFVRAVELRLPAGKESCVVLTIKKLLRGSCEIPFVIIYCCKITKEMDDFTSLEFWEKRYTKQGGLTFDWYESYKQLRLTILKDALNIYPELENCQSEWHQ